MSKAKKVLSANAEAPIGIECLMDDKDVRSSISRETFEELAVSTLSRVLQPCKDALTKSGLQTSDISVVELVGSASRIPSIANQVGAFFSREISRTLNASECVARGCALQGAMLSPAFRVKDFECGDKSNFPVAFSWQREEGDEGGDEGGDDMATKAGGANGTVVFTANNPLPSTKMLTFYRSAPSFDIAADYADVAEMPRGTTSSIGTFTVGPIPPNNNGGK